MRIVSFLAGATEMIAALGCLDWMVGRSHECDFPAEVERLPLVSHVQINVETSSAEIDAQIKQLARTQAQAQEDALKALSIYRIDSDLLQRLRPDVIFTQTQCEVCAVSERDVLQALQQLTSFTPKVISLVPYRLSDIWEDMRRVGEVLGKGERAEALVRGYLQRLERLHDVTDSLSGTGRGTARPRVTILEWLDPLMAAGNWAPELLAYAGGQSVFGEVGVHSPWLTWDQLKEADPDILVLSPCGFTVERTLEEVSLLQSHPLWQTLRAVQNGRVYAIDGNAYLHRAGPRLVESAELLARVIWGERPGIAVDQTAWRHLR